MATNWDDRPCFWQHCLCPFVVPLLGGVCVYRCHYGFKGERCLENDEDVQLARKCNVANVYTL